MKMIIMLSVVYPLCVNIKLQRPCVCVSACVRACVRVYVTSEEVI